MTKADLRKEYLDKRKNLPGNEITERNYLIKNAVTQFLTGLPVKYIHIFLPHLRKHEIDTYPIISEIRQHFPAMQLVAPYVVPGTSEMRHFELNPDTNLIQNQWQIPEPDPETSTEIQPSELDLIFIPLLAFDLRGFRVGYGGGYYDRFLKKCRPDAWKVGLSFFDAVNEIEDVDQFDIQTNACIIPDHLYRF